MLTSRFLVRTVFLLLAFIIICTVYGIRNFLSSFDQPADIAGSDHFFEIDRGQPFRVIARNLEKEKLIRNSSVFVFMGWYSDRFDEVKAGEYKLSARMTPRQIMEKITSGAIYLSSITIPEGLTIEETAKIWNDNGFGHGDEFLAAVRNFSFANFETPPTGWEGYLFPDTYALPRRSQPSVLLQMMLKRFQQVFSPEWADASALNNLTPHQTVTLASLIEKETRVPAERPLVASVFLNRLKRGMLLQCDPTVIYANRASYDGTIRRNDLELQNPYNTYTTVGLPPGPIANPGELALRAACFPAASSFYYFVADGAGGHIFNKTLEEHHDAVKQYRIGLQR